MGREHDLGKRCPFGPDTACVPPQCLVASYIAASNGKIFLDRLENGKEVAAVLNKVCDCSFEKCLQLKIDEYIPGVEPELPDLEHCKFCIGVECHSGSCETKVNLADGVRDQSLGLGTKEKIISNLGDCAREKNGKVVKRDDYAFDSLEMEKRIFGMATPGPGQEASKSAMPMGEEFSAPTNFVSKEGRCEKLGGICSATRCILLSIIGNQISLPKEDRNTLKELRSCAGKKIEESVVSEICTATRCLLYSIAALGGGALEEKDFAFAKKIFDCSYGKVQRSQKTEEKMNPQKCDIRGIFGETFEKTTPLSQKLSGLFQGLFQKISGQNR